MGILYNRFVRNITFIFKEVKEGIMLDKKRIVILISIVVIGIILGRLAVRGVMNLLLGGTLFGGNIL